MKERLRWAVGKGYEHDLSAVQRSLITYFCITPSPTWLSICMDTGWGEDAVFTNRKILGDLGLLVKVFKDYSCIDCGTSRKRPSPTASSPKTRCRACYTRQRKAERAVSIWPVKVEAVCIDCGKHCIVLATTQEPRCSKCFKPGPAHPWRKKGKAAEQKAPCPDCGAPAGRPCRDELGSVLRPHGARGKGLENGQAESYSRATEAERYP